MAVPKATMNHNYCTKLPKDEVRFARQRLIMQAIPEAASEECLSQRKLWLCIGRPDAAHIEAPLACGQNIHASPFKRTREHKYDIDRPNDS